MRAREKAVDIIIPVYNAYEDLVLCIESIWKYTDLQKNRVIIINDKSTDERIVPFLKEIEEQNIIFIDNEYNQGFSANVNKGMHYSNRDVILLNSDTIVTKNWVEKIVECAYSKDEIGTVTPLSNSATIASVPIAFQDNKIPEGYTVDEYAQLVERCSFKDYPRITVAVGFCMFIKQEVIQLVGDFDAATYERGYGEENDFCNRAEQYGYIHVLCDNTFVYHKGTVSFLSEEKQKLIDAHDKILRQRFEKQMNNNARFCAENPQQYLRDNILLKQKLTNGKKNILYVLHSDFRDDCFDHVGGTQLHVKDLVEQMKYVHNCIVVSRDNEYLRLTIYIQDERISFKFYIGKQSVFPLYKDSKLAELLQEIINFCEIDIVHVHHISSLSLDIFDIAKKLNIPLICTLHDYYYICPTVKLVDENNVYCEGKCKNDYKECLNYRCGIATQADHYLDEWRIHSLAALLCCTQLIAPSESAKKIYETAYPELKEKIIVIEHGLDIYEEDNEYSISEPIVIDKIKTYIEQAFDKNSNADAITGWCYFEGIDNNQVQTYIDVIDEYDKMHRYLTKKLNRMDVDVTFSGNGKYMSVGFICNIRKYVCSGNTLRMRFVVQMDNQYYWDGNWNILERKAINIDDTKRPNIAFIGGMVLEKGSEIAYKLITANKQDYNWFIFGGINGNDPLARLKQDNLIKIGQYSRNEICKLLSDYEIDLVCILPIWGETFCYTLSEALLSNIPVLATDIGAVGERVKKLHCGWCVSSKCTVDEINNQFTEIFGMDSNFEEVKRNLLTLSKRTIKEMSLDYIDLYKDLIHNDIDITREPYDAKLMFNALIVDEYIKKEFNYISIIQNKSDNRDAAETDEVLQKTYSELQEKQKEIDIIKASTTYRIMLRIAKIVSMIKFPFRHH